jgi:hypothetical protein
MDTVQMDALTTYEVSPDGEGVNLNFVDAKGEARAVYAPMEVLKQLTLSMPKIMLEVLQARFRDPTLRLVHTVNSWQTERASDGETIILTFTTPDRFSISFNVTEKDLLQLSDAISTYEIEAFPGGLHFH